MANPEHLALLNQGVDAWNSWRRTNPQGAIDLTGADLWGHDLNGAYLSWLDLTATRLGCSDLTGAFLTGTKLVRADLSSAILSGAHLSMAQFLGSSLNLTDFSRAQMGWTVFAWSDLGTCKGLESVFHEAPSAIDLETLIRSGSNIPMEFLRGAGAPVRFIERVASLVLDPTEFYSCFISYSHADKPFARHLHNALHSRGISCWLDEKQLFPGDPIYEHVDRGIRLWDKFLLCCSEHSLKPASWVDKEIITALEKEDELTRQRNEKVHALIPLNLDGYIFTDGWKSGYRAQIRSRLAADFTRWETEAGKFEREVENVIRATQGRSKCERETAQIKALTKKHCPQSRDSA